MSIIGPVDRRGFLVGAAALGVAATLPRLGRAATPSKGGHFRIGVADYATQDDLDPANIDTRFQTYPHSAWTRVALANVEYVLGLAGA